MSLLPLVLRDEAERDLDDSSMDDPTFSPGFRFSTLDGVVLIVGGAAAAGISLISMWIGVATAFAVAHFFVFCNEFRISRPLELIWAGTFAALAVLAMAQLVVWPVALTASLILTLVVIVIEARRPSYHGVAWKRLNPQLEAWWRARSRQ